MALSYALTCSPSKSPKATSWNLPSLMQNSSPLLGHYTTPMKKPRYSQAAGVPNSYSRHINAFKGEKLASSVLLHDHANHNAAEMVRREKNILSLKNVRTLLIDNYDSYTYNLFQLLSVVNGVVPVVIKNDQLTWDYVHHLLYERHAFDNIVISPGPGSPTCTSDIGICMQILHGCKDIPILGVCLGHQALGHAHRAKIIHAPQPVHGRLSEVQHSGSDLFHGIPSGAGSGFSVVRYHSLIIDANTLPNDLIPIAWTSTLQSVYQWSNKFQRGSLEVEICASKNFQFSNLHEQLKSTEAVEEIGILMGIMHSSRPHYGLQFHPESVSTCYGKKLLENFRNITSRYWLSSPRKMDRKISECFSQKSYFDAHISGSMMSASADVMKSWDMVTTDSYDVTRDTTKKPSTVLSLRWERLPGFATRAGGSAKIFTNLFGNTAAENTFWLDSSTIDHGRARFSFMGCKGGSLWKCISYRLCNDSVGGYISVQDGKSSVTEQYAQSGFFDFMEKELQSITCPKEAYEGLPFDFVGGYIGYIGYELKIECGARRNHHKSKLPDACFFLADRVLVIDHLTDDVYILSLFPSASNSHVNSDIQGSPNNEKSSTRSGFNAIDEKFEDAKNDTLRYCFNGSIPSCRVVSDEKTDCEAWIKDTKCKLLMLAENVSNPTKERETSVSLSMDTHIHNQPETFKLHTAQDQYIANVNKCMEYIIDGESYELCLTTQFSKKVAILDHLQLYLMLRRKNPAPYAAWLSFQREELYICSSSPERFLKLDQSGILEAKPIKGTISRGKSQKEDEDLRTRLQNSEKDQAENLMIVDLLRNDLGRVCEPGSVHVPSLMDLESYATVHTLVSTIRGKKRVDINPVQCVRAAFPGGSMTGAPKLRAMELLDSVENIPRGVYSGAIGYFSFNQTFDFNIVIRTIVVNGDEVSIGAGGAVVSLSDPEDEYNEMILKAKAPIFVVNEAEREVIMN